LFDRKGRSLVGRKWIDFVPDERRETTRQLYDELAEKPKIMNYEHPVRLADGTERWFHWTDMPLFDFDGNLVEFQSVGRDITERKKAESAVEEMTKRYQLLVDTIPNALFLVDKTGTIVDANEKAAIVTGRERTKLPGADIAKFLHPEHGGSIREMLEGLFEKKPRSATFKLQQKDADKAEANVRLDILSAEGNGLIQCMVTPIPAGK
jgi:PAS domain S-box-containing protein